MTSESLTAFITRKRQELEKEEAPLKERLAEIQLERSQLTKAAIAAGIEPKPETGSEPKRRGPRPRQGTIKDIVVKILSDGGQGLTAINLLAELNHRNGTTLMRSSLSPQLSRLKDEGLICLTGNYWHLPGQPPINTNTPNEEPGPSLFAENGPGTSKPVPEAQGVKAAPGGGG